MPFPSSSKSRGFLGSLVVSGFGFRLDFFSEGYILMIHDVSWFNGRTLILHADRSTASKGDQILTFLRIDPDMFMISNSSIV
jgi:hypothetical protein